MFTVRVISIDEYCFTGREFHPQETDVGVSATVISMVTGSTDYGQYLRATFRGKELGPKEFRDEPGLDMLAATLDPTSYQVLHCVTFDGRKLDLMGHEVEFYTPIRNG